MSPANITEFEKIYDNYSPAVYGMISNCIKDKVVANEMLADIFTQFFYHAKDQLKNFSLLNLLSFSRKIICTYINENRDSTYFHPLLLSSKELIDERMVQLICLGKNPVNEGKAGPTGTTSSFSQHISAAIINYMNPSPSF